MRDPKDRGKMHPLALFHGVSASRGFATLATEGFFLKLNS